jgi:hypothetical protein
MHLTTPSHWSRSIGTNGRNASERVVMIAGMRTSFHTNRTERRFRHGKVAAVGVPSRFGGWKRRFTSTRNASMEQGSVLNRFCKRHPAPAHQIASAGVGILSTLHNPAVF